MKPASSSRRTPSRARSAWGRADAQGRHELVLHAAMDLLRTGGVAALTMRAVADRLGIAVMTLYTYTDGLDELRRRLVERGFAIMRSGCEQHADPPGPHRWREGARRYLRFASENPSLYELMFGVPVNAPQDLRVLEHGIQPLMDAVREQLLASGLSAGMEEADLRRRVRVLAGRFWVALHGLASLTVSGRLGVLEGGQDGVLDDLLDAVSPARTALTELTPSSSASR